MSVFREILEKAKHRAEDVELLMIMGVDGIAVEKLAFGQDSKLESLAAEFAALMHSRFAGQRETNMGDLVELRMTSEDVTLIAVSVNPEYFLFAALPSEGLAGRARYALRISAERLAQELA